jgi:hypothetical protein
LQLSMVLCFVLVIFELTGLAIAANSPVTNQVTSTLLIEAARRATLSDIDYGSTYCDGANTVEAWLKALVGPEARAITWTGGRCQLIDELNPLDAGGRWCAQATISLVHPKDRNDTPRIEVYLEAPRQGRPDRAYAFRSVMMTPDGAPMVIGTIFGSERISKPNGANVFQKQADIG